MSLSRALYWSGCLILAGVCFAQGWLPAACIWFTTATITWVTAPCQEEEDSDV